MSPDYKQRLLYELHAALICAMEILLISGQNTVNGFKKNLEKEILCSGTTDRDNRGNPHDGKTDTWTAGSTDGRKVGQMDVIQKPEQRRQPRKELRLFGIFLVFYV